jgi:small-conductance mechanosensitive channel
MFADDTNIIIKQQDQGLSTVQSQIETKLMNWVATNRLIINYSKTVLINFSAHGINEHQPKFILDGNSIQETENGKFLGIWVDSKLTWKKHIDTLLKKLSSYTYMMRRLSKITSSVTLKVMYHAHINSLIKYGLIFWGKSSFARKVFLVQKKIVRIMSSSRFNASCKPLFRSLNILPLPCMYILESVTYIHESKSVFKKNSEYHDYQTRIANNLHIDNARLKKTQNFIRHEGLKLYNKLPNKMKEMPTLIFKKNVKKLLSKYMFYDVSEYYCTNLVINY